MATSPPTPTENVYQTQMELLCKISVPAVRKNFYTPAASVEKLKPEEVSQFRYATDIAVYGDDVPKPIRKFSESTLPKSQLQRFAEEGFTKPSPIQSQAWPAALSGRDVIGVAETGSGKTLAFLCPMLVHVGAQPARNRGDGPLALILVPTRELAVQIMEELEKYQQGCRCTCIYGGVPKGDQIRDLHGGVDIAVGTPGRLLDVLDCKATNLRRVGYFVLDEADRMLDMGFAPHIQKLADNLTQPDRQTLMFTATWTKEVEKLSKTYLKTPIKITVGGLQQGYSANNNIQQTVQIIKEDDKASHFIRILREIPSSTRILVFVTTRVRTDELHAALKDAGWAVGAIHGDKRQTERDKAIAAFRDGSVPILLATDVAARGLDIKDVPYVVNFDMPTNIELYIHRIGRTGRAGSYGNAVSFFTYDDMHLAPELVKILDQSGGSVERQLRDWASRESSRQNIRERRKEEKKRLTKHYQPYEKQQLITKIATGSADAAKQSNNETRGSLGNPSQVVLLRNMVGPGEVDAELKLEVQNECEQKFGGVKTVLIHEVDHWSIKPEEAVRIFVQFHTLEAARKCLVMMSGRVFGGRVICAAFYDIHRWAIRDFEPSSQDPVMPTVLLLRNMALKSELDDYLQKDVFDECSKYGEVKDVHVFILKDSSTQNPSEQIRIFVRFSKYEACMNAYQMLHGRMFSGRIVYACFYDEAAFLARQLAPTIYEPKMSLPRQVRPQPQPQPQAKKQYPPPATNPPVGSLLPPHVTATVMHKRAIEVMPAGLVSYD